MRSGRLLPICCLLAGLVLWASPSITRPLPPTGRNGWGPGATVSGERRALSTNSPPADRRWLGACRRRGRRGPAVVGDRVYVMDLARELDENGQPAARPGKGSKARSESCASTSLMGTPSGPTTTTAPTRSLIRTARGPRRSSRGRVYAPGAMGDLACLNVADGKPRGRRSCWKAYQTEPPVWGYAAHPLIDGDLLYVPGGRGQRDRGIGQEDSGARSGRRSRPRRSDTARR